MNLEILAINIKNLLAAFDCKNGQDLKRKRAETNINDNPLLFALPSHNTIDKLLKMQTANPRENVLLDCINCYMRLYSANITMEDFCTKLLPFQVEYGMKIPDIYEDFYYSYILSLSKNTNNTKMGMFHIFIKENRYHVRALLNLRNHETMTNASLLHFMKNPDANFETLHSLIPELPDEENYYSYFEGDLELNDDFARINLHRPENFPLSTSRNQISIYLRRINEDMRNRLYGAVCMIISNGFDRNLNIQRMLLSNRFIPKDDALLQKLLRTPDPSVTDKDAFAWYLYVKNGGR